VMRYDAWLRDDDFAEQRALMVERQLVARGIEDERMLAAMRAVPREFRRGCCVSGK
jgi:hypothetical protein